MIYILIFYAKSNNQSHHKFRSWFLESDNSFQQKYTPKHEKGRRVPLNPLLRVTEELNRLEKEGHVEKISNCCEEIFISPIVITVKIERTKKFLS